MYLFSDAEAASGKQQLSLWTAQLVEAEFSQSGALLCNLEGQLLCLRWQCLHVLKNADTNREATTANQSHVRNHGGSDKIICDTVVRAFAISTTVD